MVVGAGIGGLVAALELAARGVDVTVIERAAGPGGKLREAAVAGRQIDAGPTVFTMRWVFEDIFRSIGESLDAHLTLRPVELLARHAWDASGHLDLFANIERSADAIGRFAGASEARGYRHFCADAGRIYRTLEQPFIKASRPNLLRLVASTPPRDLWRISPFTKLWRALGRYFNDPRLRQLFGRYSTYCGSSPYQAAATLMLVAHVEQTGVWLVAGGMRRVATVLADLAVSRGVAFRYECEAEQIIVQGGRATGLALCGGEVLAADSIIVNADVAALSAGRFGEAARVVVPRRPANGRSLSAVTWATVATAQGLPLTRHNVYFSDDYESEFSDIFHRSRLPRRPTVYVCAQDRDEAGSGTSAERFLCLVNAPPNGDAGVSDPWEIEQCRIRTFRHMEQCGLTLNPLPQATVTTTPADFERLFPATGGALYGAASHGWMASFQRPGPATKLPGLYLAGGSVHPGPGLPMAALSGRAAAASIVAGFASTAR